MYKLKISRYNTDNHKLPKSYKLLYRWHLRNKTSLDLPRHPSRDTMSDALFHARISSDTGYAYPGVYKAAFQIL